MTIGDKIRMVRTTKGLSQENLAEMLNISLVAYSKLERNESEIGYTRLMQIADALEMKVHELTAIGEPGVVFQFNKIQQNDGIAFSTAQIINYNNEIAGKLEQMENRLNELENKS